MALVQQCNYLRLAKVAMQFPQDPSFMSRQMSKIIFGNSSKGLKGHELQRLQIRSPYTHPFKITYFIFTVLKLWSNKRVNSAFKLGCLRMYHSWFQPTLKALMPATRTPLHFTLCQLKLNYFNLLLTKISKLHVICSSVISAFQYFSKGEKKNVIFYLLSSYSFAKLFLLLYIKNLQTAYYTQQCMFIMILYISLGKNSFLSFQ